MKNKILIYISCFVFFLFSIVVSVYALGAATDSAGDAAETDKSRGNGTTGWPEFTINGKATVVAGIRISFVDSLGNHQKSTDYIIDSTYDAISQKRFIVTGKKYSKTTYVNNNSVDFNSEITVGLDKDIKKLSTLISSSDGTIFKTNFLNSFRDSNIQNFKQGDLFDFLKVSNNINNPKYATDILKLFSNLSEYSEEALLSNNDLFLIHEPITVVKIENKFYMGTAYELAVLAKQSPGGGFIPSQATCKGSQGGALCDLWDVTNHDLPCATYLSGELSDEMNDILGNSTDTKDQDILNRFTDTTYFNNLIQIPGNNSYSNTCSSSERHFSYNAVVSNAGIGMGIVWLGSYITDIEQVTCEEVKEGITWDFETSFKNGYNANGLAGIKAKFPGGYISYRTGNTTKYANLDWFLYECTCYGVMDYYKTDTDVKLGDLNKNQIQNIFKDLSGKFIKYQNNIQNLINEHMDTNNKWPNQEYGDVTVWDYNKYNSLNCPYDGSSSGGGNEGPEKYNCTPQYNVGDCLTGEDVYYTDNNNIYSEDEFFQNCVFNADEDSKYYDEDINHKESKDLQSNLSYYDDDISSDYCEVYCIESVETDFLSKQIKIEAGKHFTWDNHSISGSRTCKTKSINYTKFEKDLSEANKEIIDAYLNWELEKALADVEWTKSSTKNCDCDWVTDYDNPLGPNEKGEMTYGKKCQYSKYSYTPSKTSVTVSVTVNGIKYTKTKNLSRSCGSKGYTANTSKAKKNYTNALNYGSKIVDEIKQCFNEDELDGGNSWDKYGYSVNPQLNVSYSDNIYSYEGTLEGDTNYSSEGAICLDKYNNEVTKYNTSNKLITGCSGTTCTLKSQNIKYCDKVTMETVANTTFDLEDGVFAYVSKQNNIAFSKNGEKERISSFYKGQYSDFSAILASIGSDYTFNYDEVGYSNFPVAYQTVAGIYGNGNGDLSLYYTNLGHQTSSTTAVDSILSDAYAKNNKTYGDWICEYEVVEGLIKETCDPKVEKCDKDDKLSGGIKVIYRPIDLINPFPDINASGRNTGSNWCAKEDCTNTNAVVKNIINNNRGVSDYEVYNLEPMYSFTLTPAIIKQIREYNNKNEYNSYTGEIGGEIIDFVCEKGTGRNCSSGYLDYLKDNTSIKASGTCMETSYRSGMTTSANFETCR